VLAGTTLAAVLVLVLLSIPRLRWWERRRAAAAAHQARPAASPRPPVVRPAVAGPEPPGELASFRPAHHSIGNGGTSPHPAPAAESIAVLPSPQEAHATRDDPADTLPMEVPKRASGSIIP